jgi:hypothetical protein
MKLTKTELRQIIKEEMSFVMKEDSKIKQILQKIFKRGEFEQTPFTKDEIKQLEQKGWDAKQMYRPHFRNTLVGWDNVRRSEWPTHVLIKRIHNVTNAVQYVIGWERGWQTSETEYDNISRIPKAPTPKGIHQW